MAKKGRRKGRKAKGGTTSSPGVLVEEVPSGAKPIEGVGTTTPAFVGFAENGPVLVRRAGALLLLVTGAAAGMWASRHRPALRPFD